MKELYDELIFIIAEENVGIRLDQYLSTALNISREKIKNLFEQNLIKSGSINNTKQNLKLSQKTSLDDSFVVKIPIKNTEKIIKNDLNFALEDFIVHEDANYLILNKPAGLLSQNTEGNEVSVVNLAKKYLGYDGVGQEGREFLVHRLDRETSGLMVLAKNHNSYEFLTNAFREKTITKKYLGLVWGVPNPICHSINKNIVRDERNRTKMRVSIKKDEGRLSTTHYRVKESFFNKAISLVEFVLETGRTHQIRVHMDFLGHGIVGDKLYGRTKNHSFSEDFADIKSKIDNIERHMLHSYFLSIPGTNDQEQSLDFEIELPDDIYHIIN